MNAACVSTGGNIGQSEQLFEEYLNLNGYSDWQYEPDIPGKKKHPDYSLPFAGETLFIEVKELICKRPFPERAVTINPYRAIRSKIHQARVQFQEHKQDCCVLIVYNAGDWEAGQLRTEAVFGAMLGDLGFSVKIGVGKKSETLLLSTKQTIFLGGGKMGGPKTKHPQNTTISAIVVLEKYSFEDPEFLRAVRNKTKDCEQSVGHFLECDERTSIRISLYEQFPEHRHEALRVRVHENPHACIALPKPLFTGPYDERWVFNYNTFTRIFAGSMLLDAEKLARELQAS